MLLPFPQRLRSCNTARDAEWNPDDVLTLSFRGNELAGEVGEVCNILKKMDREILGLVGSRATEPQLIEELADAIICIDLICMQLGISPERLEQGIVDKFNKTSTERGLSVTMEH